MLATMPTEYSLADLCDLADVTPRTVRYYIAQGLLHAPSGAGPGTRYDDGHLNRLRVIKRLQRDHLPLAEIRTRLAAVSDEDVERIAAEPDQVAETAADYIARVLATRGLRKAQVPDLQRAAPPLPGSPPAQSPRMVVRAQAASPNPPARSQWERLVLNPDVEIHVRRPLGRERNRQVERLVEAAREIFQEEPR
jgi:DNA-binding transcriptional MerR regulator